MKERLVIQNFGPIKFVDLELSRFNVFIGDQGTGKSTIAKLLIAINNTCFREIFDAEGNNNFDRTQLFLEHLKLVGINSYIKPSTEINFISSQYEFSYTNKKVSENSGISFDESLAYDFTYIPSERSLAIMLADALYALMQEKVSLPRLLLRFGDKFQKARKSKDSFDYQTILGISYSHTNEKDIVTLLDGADVDIADTSSGIQGNIALLTVFDYVTEKNVFRKGNLLVVEEPELNLFPNTQRKIIEHIVNNTLSFQSLITTHSPYILASLNNLIYAYNVGQEHEEEVNVIIDKKYWLNPDDVRAYRLLDNGEARNIIDEDLKEIAVEEIDGASKEINAVYDRILKVKFGANEEA